MSISSALKRSVRSGAVYAPSYIVPQLLTVITFPVYTRVFSPSDYGLLALISITTGFLTILAVDWVQSSILRFYAQYCREERIRDFYRIVLLTSLLTLGVWMVISLVTVTLLGDRLDPRARGLVLIGLASFLVDGTIRICLTLLRVLEKAVTYTAVAIAQAGMRAFFGITLALVLRNVSGVLWAGIISGLAVLLPLFRAVAPKDLESSLPVSDSRFNRHHDAIEFISYGLPLLISSLSWYGLDVADRYLVQYFRGSYEVGLYSAGYSISSYGFAAIFALLGFSSYPVIVATYETHGKTAVEELLKGLNRYYLMISLPAVLGVSILSKPIVSVLAGEAYHEAYTVIPLVALGVFFNGLLPFCGKSFVLLKRNKLYAAIALANALLNILLNLILIPYFGYMGAALATALSYASTFLSLWIVGKFVLKFSYNFSAKSILRILVSGLLMSLCLWLMISRISDGIGILILEIVTGAVAYILFLFVTREISLRELVLIFGQRRLKSLAIQDPANLDNPANDGQLEE